MSSEGPKTMSIQQMSSALSLTHRYFSSFSESFDDVIHCRWWDLQSICNLTLRNIFILLPRIDGIAHLTSFLFLRSVRKTLKILCRFFVTQISVIPHSKPLGVYFYLCTLTIRTTLCFCEIKKINRVRVLSQRIHDTQIWKIYLWKARSVYF